MKLKTKKVDHSGTLPKNRLPAVPPLELIIYHWSPTTNRNRINHDGLCPGRLSLQGDWRPPYVCFSSDPHLAWILSGRMYPGIKSWDLWMCHVPSQTSFDHWEICLDTYIDSGRHYIKEYRIYTRVFKRDLVYVATKEQ